MSGAAGLARLTALLAAGAALVVAARANLDPYALSVLQFAGLNVILAVSLNITNGFIGLFSLGHPAFMTLGGYVTAILVMPSPRKTLMLPDLPAILAAQEWPFLAALLGRRRCSPPRSP